MRSTPSGEEQWEDAPAHAVIEVIDEPGLRGCEEIAVAEGGECEDLPEANGGYLAGAVASLQTDVLARVTYSRMESAEPRTA